MKENLPVRKKIRLKYYNYSKEGLYFITICVKNRLELLSKINDLNAIELTEEGKIADNYIKNIGCIYSNIKIDEYIIMPNHIHIILLINNKEKITISQIIKQYKMSVSKSLGYSIWQKSFYEHIIRNEKDYIKIKEYIIKNPLNWKDDIYF